MKTDNKGFTLVELIVSIVILSIVLLAAFGFMVSGAKSYASVDTRINRQLKSQLTLGQVGDCLMNCNTGINVSADGKAVYILSTDSATNEVTVQAFKLDGDKNVQYASAKATVTNNTKDGVTTTNYATTIAAADWSKVTTKAKSFAVTLSPADGKVTSAAISVQFTGSDVSYTKTVALRNAPPRVEVTVS